MRESFKDLFAHPRWRDYQRALGERLQQIEREMENWQPVMGADSGTNLADLQCRLREAATIRWMRDEVPTLLTESEERVQRGVEQGVDAHSGGDRYAEAHEGDRTAGEEEYDPDDEDADS